MQINNISEGQIFKNYKELCAVLEIEVKNGGTAKKSQLKELSRYFLYEKKGHNFIIKEIYKIPLPPNNNITKYIPIIEKLILHIIISNGQEGILYINKSKLYEMLKMINNRYTSMKYHKMQLSKKYDISKETIKDFYSTSDDLLERNVEQALKSLERQSLIKFNTVYSVCEIETKNIYNRIAITNDLDEYGDEKTNAHVESVNKIKRKHRQTTEQETAIILRLQRERLKHLECTTMNEIYSKGIMKDFFTPIKQYLLDNHNIEYYYTSYEMIFNIDHVNEAYRDLELFLLDDESYYLSSSLLNIHISDKLETMAVNRSNKANDTIQANDMHMIRRDEQYIKDIKTLIEKLVHNK